MPSRFLGGVVRSGGERRGYLVRSARTCIKDRTNEILDAIPNNGLVVSEPESPLFELFTQNLALPTYPSAGNALERSVDEFPTAPNVLELSFLLFGNMLENDVHDPCVAADCATFEQAVAQSCNKCAQESLRDIPCKSFN